MSSMSHRHNGVSAQAVTHKTQNNTKFMNLFTNKTMLKSAKAVGAVLVFVNSVSDVSAQGTFPQCAPGYQPYVKVGQTADYVRENRNSKLKGLCAGSK